MAQPHSVSDTWEIASSIGKVLKGIISPFVNPGAHSSVRAARHDLAMKPARSAANTPRAAATGGKPASRCSLAAV